MTDLTLLHTAHVHCETFDRLAPDAELNHIVRPDWLKRAQGGIDLALKDEIFRAIAEAVSPVLCTCTTIGEVAESAGATRIDWPMMQDAARIGGPVLMVYCLQSTKAPSEALLRRAFAGKDPQLSLLYLDGIWPMFEAGQAEEFARSIADQTAQALNKTPYRSVVLAQASMAGAANHLRNLTEVPVLTSPDLALQSCLKTTGTTNDRSKAAP